MLIVFIALTIAVGAQALGGGISNLFTNISASLNNVAANLPGNLPNP